MLPSEIEYFQDVAKRLDKTKHGGKTKLIQNIAETLGISINLIYEKLEKVGYQSNRKVRSDRGETHVDLRDARLICGAMYKNRRKNEKSLLTCENAIADAYANGQIKQLYNPTTLLRVARMHGFHPDQLNQPTPHINMRSLHPNHVWQVDASVGVLFYLPEGGVQFFDETKDYKNKPENLDKARNHLCVRYAVIDHFSGAFYCKYYATSGENQEVFFDVLANAFTQRDREDFYGIPQILIMDKGSANTSHLVLNFLDRLHIQHFPHKAGNPRAKGSAEKIQDIIEVQFEGSLRNRKTKVSNVDDLNQMVTRWQTYFNGSRIHTRTKQPRYTVWNRIKEDQLIFAPPMETLKAILTSKPVLRKVNDDLRITYKGRGFAEARTYSVEHIETVKVGGQVSVLLNPFRAPNIDIEITDYKGIVTLHECIPLEEADGGFFAVDQIFGEGMASIRDTVSDVERKQIHLDAHGATTLEEADKKAKQNPQLYGGKLDPETRISAYLKDRENIISIPKRGTEHELQAPKQVLEFISIAEACKRIKADLGDKYPKDTYQYLSKHYTEIDPLEIDSIKRQLTTRSTLKVVGE